MLAFSYSLVVADFFLRAFVLILSQKLYKYTFCKQRVFFYLVPINRRFSTLVGISFSQSNGSFIGLKNYFFYDLHVQSTGCHMETDCVSQLYIMPCRFVACAQWFGCARKIIWRRIWWKWNLITNVNKIVVVVA